MWQVAKTVFLIVLLSGGVLADEAGRFDFSIFKFFEANWKSETVEIKKNTNHKKSTSFKNTNSKNNFVNSLESKNMMDKNTLNTIFSFSSNHFENELNQKNTVFSKDANDINSDRYFIRNRIYLNRE